MEELTKEQRIALIRGELFKHDWCWNWADDNKTYFAGKSDQQRIVKMALESGITREELVAIVKETQKSPEVIVQWEGASYEC